MPEPRSVPSSSRRMGQGRPALWHGFTNMRQFEANTLCIQEADGIWVTDTDGKRYINAISSLLNLNLGGGCTEIVDAIAKQAEKLPYFTIERATHEIAEIYAERLIERTPEGLNRVFYASTGAEAVEWIIKLARQYQRIRYGKNTRKLEFISLDRGFHGVTLGALSATGSVFAPWREPYEPLLPGFHHVETPYPYRCTLGCGGVCNLACAESVERKIQELGEDRVAAVIIEPVLGGGGAHAPTMEYHRRLREICDAHDVLLVFDEVITGFGRLGSWFGADHFGVTPDLMALSKGINGGYLPFGAVVLRDQIYEAFDASSAGYIPSGSTTNGHPVCCASALATLDYMDREKIVPHARAAGEHMFERFQELEHHPLVGEIRGAGLLMALELVSNRETKTPMPPELWDALSARLALNGVIAACSSAEMGVTYMLIAPPLIIETEEIDEMYARIKTVLDHYSRLIHGSRS
jgi:adenosylmethionine-8-amino-7-oxononanoate aminotransferase